MHTLELKPGESAIFGYGSLLWQPSMERTLGRPYDRAPCIAHLPGWRRTWDVAMRNATFYYVTDEGTRCVPDRIAYLNVCRADSVLNGLMYVVAPDALAAFDAREEPYERREIGRDIIDVAVSGGPVYIYVGKPDRRWAPPQSPQQVAIRSSYLDIVEHGLAVLGGEFRADYERSTDPPPPANVIEDRLDSLRAR